MKQPGAENAGQILNLNKDETKNSLSYPKSVFFASSALKTVATRRNAAPS